MYKALVVAILLLPTFALGQRSNYAPTTSYASPQIVAKGKFPNQTAPIPITAILTPKEDGLYRFSAYGTITTAQGGNSEWNVNLFWNDDSGLPQSVLGLLIAFGGTSGQFVEFGYVIATNGGAVSVFEAKAGTPITYSVTQFGPPDNSAYSLYYTLERLE
jgi:hypothetical protein